MLLMIYTSVQLKDISLTSIIVEVFFLLFDKAHSVSITNQKFGRDEVLDTVIIMKHLIYSDIRTK